MDTDIVKEVDYSILSALFFFFKENTKVASQFILVRDPHIVRGYGSSFNKDKMETHGYSWLNDTFPDLLGYCSSSLFYLGSHEICLCITKLYLPASSVHLLLLLFIYSALISA